MADDNCPVDHEPYFASHPDNPSTFEDDRYNDWGWARDGPGPENRQRIWERQPAPSIHQSGTSSSAGDHMDDVPSKNFSPSPTTNSHLLPKAFQAGLMRDQIAGYMRHVRRRHIANLNEWRREGVDGQTQLLPAQFIQTSIQPSISTSSHQEDRLSPHDLKNDVTTNDSSLLPLMTMNPQLLDDLDQAANATQGLPVSEQIAAMNTALQKRANLDDSRGRVVDGQPQPLPGQSIQMSIQPSISAPSGPWDGLHLQPEHSGQTIQDIANSRQVVQVEMSGASSLSSGPRSHNQDNGKDNWSSESYQKAASFVPRMTKKVVQLLDVQPDDVILDIGCGDGVLTRQIAEKLKDGTGTIWGIDSSPAMIEAAIQHASDGSISSHGHGFAVMDANKLFHYLQCTNLTALDRHKFGVVDSFQAIKDRYTKIFSNAALHWILRNPSTREDIFLAIFQLLAPGGYLVFEMGGHGNVSELHTALLAATAHRVGIEAARAADPWFFADEAWMRGVLVKSGFTNLEIETEYRPTRATVGESGGIEGWVRLMGQRFLNAVRSEERESFVKEVCGTLKTVCATESGEEWIGYVRLRVKAMKPSACGHDEMV